MSLELPGLIVHDDHIDIVKDLITLQLAEGFHACIYQCITMTVLKRLLKPPSKAVQDAVQVPTMFSTAILDFFCNSPTTLGIQGLLGWPTLHCALAEMATVQLNAYLQDKAPQMATDS